MAPRDLPPAPHTRLLAGVAATFLLLLVLAAPAFGHASLVSTTPADGAELGSSPSEVVLSFSEPVEVPPAGIRVFDGSGERVDTGAVDRADATTVSAPLAAGLDDGSYIVTWRAVSEDGHPIRGAFVYTVGEGEVDEDLLARLFSGDSEALVAAVAAVVRGAAYLGTLVAGGALLFLVRAAAGQPVEQDRARRWARRGAWLGIVATVLGVPLQSMVTTGFGPLAAMAPDVLTATLDSSFGVAAGVRLVGLAGALFLVGAASVPALTAGTLAVVSFALDGHTRTVDPGWLVAGADVVHLLAAAAWLGGIVVLFFTVRSRRVEDDPTGAATLVARFSGIATVSVVLVTLAGFTLSWALVRQPRALTSSSYGWTLLAKILVAAAVIAVGVYNNRHLVPRAAEPGAWRRLGTTLRFEAVALIVLLAITGFLVNQRPAAEAAGITGAYEVYEDVTDELQLNLVVDPNRAGANEIHLYLLDATGRPAGEVEDVRFRLSKPDDDIGPIERDPLVAGPGHWVLSGRELSLPGDWVVEIVLGVDRFTEETVEVPVTVNP